MSDDQDIVYTSVKETAERLDVGLQTVRNWCRDMRLPGAIKDGNKWKIPATVTTADVVPLADKLARVSGDERITRLLAEEPDDSEDVSADDAETELLRDIVDTLSDITAEPIIDKDKLRAASGRLVSALGGRVEVPDEETSDGSPELPETPSASDSGVGTQAEAQPAGAPDSAAGVDEVPAEDQGGAEGADADRAALETLLAGGQPSAVGLEPFNTATDEEPDADDTLLDDPVLAVEVDPGEPLPPKHWEATIDDPRDAWED